MKWFKNLVLRFGNLFTWRSHSESSNNITIQARDSTIHVGRDESTSPARQQDDCARLHILFIDDDQKNQVVAAVKNAGFTHTTQVKDITNLDDQRVKSADVIFVDIIGVGRKLFPTEQGLGLAVALKAKYPTKRVAVYSTETGGDRADPKLRQIDAFLAKTAQPYEFVQHIQEWVESK